MRTKNFFDNLNHHQTALLQTCLSFPQALWHRILPPDIVNSPHLSASPLKYTLIFKHALLYMQKVTKHFLLPNFSMLTVNSQSFYSALKRQSSIITQDDNNCQKSSLNQKDKELPFKESLHYKAFPSSISCLGILFTSFYYYSSAKQIAHLFQTARFSIAFQPKMQCTFQCSQMCLMPLIQ